MAALQDMRSVKADARRELGGVDGVLGFGLGDRTLRVYVRDPGVRDRLPEEYRDVPVEVVVTGDVVAQPAR